MLEKRPLRSAGWALVASDGFGEMLVIGPFASILVAESYRKQWVDGHAKQTCVCLLVPAFKPPRRS
jgi:hypothetical protein